MAHQRSEVRVRVAQAQILDAHAEARHVLARQIDAPLLEIDRDVLPEVRELQAAAHLVGETLAPEVAIAE